MERPRNGTVPHSLKESCGAVGVPLGGASGTQLPTFGWLVRFAGFHRAAAHPLPVVAVVGSVCARLRKRSAVVVAAAAVVAAASSKGMGSYGKKLL